MIPFTTSFSWLNFGDYPHVSRAGLAALDAIADPANDEAARNKAVENMVMQARDAADPFEYPEALVYSAWYFKEWNCFDEALHSLQEAEKVYEALRDMHRQAVTRWLCSNIKWTLLNNEEAHADAKKAREMFNQMRQHVLKMRFNSGRNEEPHAFKLKLEAKTSWYLDQIKKMDQEIFSTPEEAYFLIFQFGGSLLNAYAVKLKESIKVALKAREYPEARRMMTDLLDSCHQSLSYEETGDALAFCGLMVYQMDEYTNSLFFLEKAVRAYLPDSHKRVLTGWMQAMVCMKNTSKPTWRQQAIELAEDAIQGMRKLSAEADRRNEQNRCKWYDVRLDWMQEIMKEL